MTDDPDRAPAQEPPEPAAPAPDARRQHEDDVALRARALDLKARELDQTYELRKLELTQSAAPEPRRMQYVTPAIASLVTAVAVAILTGGVEMWLNLASAEQAQELQQRQQRFEIIVQATDGVPRDVALQNLRFFVDAGILSDDSGAITRAVEIGQAPTLGPLGRVNNLVAGPAARALIKDYLTLSLSPVTGVGGTLTIGYGHVIERNELVLLDGRVLDLTGDPLTAEEAEALFDRDLRKIEDSINSNVLAKLTQPQFDALASLIFDIGIGTFERSELRRALNAGDFDVVPGLMRAWVNVDNVPIQELRDRRDREILLWDRSL